MWQAEVRVDLDAIEANVALLRAGTAAEVMAVVKGDGYGHGMVPAAQAALRGGATWLGGCTVDEALTLRAAGLTVPVLAWLMAPGLDLGPAITADVDLTASTPATVDEIVAASRRTGRTARIHLKLDTGLARGGASPAEWPVLCEAAAKAQADGDVAVIGTWSHLVHADEPDHAENDRQLEAFRAGLATAERLGINPAYRHLANSAATLTRPETHFDLVRPGIACYGLSPVPGRDFGLRPAMTVRARVALTKRVPGRPGRVVWTHVHDRAGDHPGADPARVRRRGAALGQQPGPGAGGRRQPEHRGPGVYGPDRGRLRQTPRLRPATWQSSLDRGPMVNPLRMTGPRPPAPSTTRSSPGSAACAYHACTRPPVVPHER